MILDPIIASTRDELARRRALVPEEALRERIASAAPVRSLTAAVRASDLGLIAEFKRRSPSAGAIVPVDADPVDVARAYVRARAAGMSVLTESAHFGGSLDDLRRVRAAVDLPLLRKDFVVDPYQLLEARAAGADAVLLIARVLRGDIRAAPLCALLDAAAELGLEALVEVHDARDLDDARIAGACLIGINNRDLDTLVVDLGVTEQLAARAAGPGVTLIGESGVRTAADVARLQAAGVHGLLVGETLMRADDPEAAVAQLLPRPAGVDA